MEQAGGVPSIEASEAGPDDSSAEAQVQALSLQAHAQLEKGRWQDSIALFAQVAALTEDTATRAEALNAGAGAHLADKGWDAAEKQATEALNLFRALGDRAGEATVLSNLAAAHDGLGDWGKAEALYTEVLAMREAQEDLEGQAKTLRNLAILYAQHSNPAKAKALLNKALTLAKRVGSAPLTAVLRKTMSQIPRLGRR